jgi:DNA helicase II / ATP-dependent DNA helicase PcrA
MPFLNELNKVQQQAVKAINGPVMIIAGAGSGKTRVLTYRIAYLIQKGIPTDNILALTFTNKAAKEMKERIKGLIGRKSDGLWMGTFHSVFAKILRNECEKIGYHKNFNISDSDESLSLIKNIMAGLNIPTDRFNPYSVQSTISRAKNKLISPTEMANNAAEIYEMKVSEIFKDYQVKLKNNNCMDFDDLLLLPISLFQRFPEILDKYQKIFHYILVDEYQDTNKAQYILLKQLASKYKNLCVVGDDAQSIYSFRGAEIQNVLDYQIDFKDHQLFRLEQNYRSTKKILEAADCVIKNNHDQIKKKLWTENGEGEDIILLECRDEKDEGQQIIRNIEFLIKRDKLPLNSFVILYRTNAQSRALEEALRRFGLPYIIVGGIKFYERKEIKDILAYLKFISNPLNDEALDRIINYPVRGIGATSLNKIKQHAYKNHISIFKALETIDELKSLQERVVTNCKMFVQFIYKYMRLKDEMTLNEFVSSLIDELRLIEELKMQATPEALARAENIQEFVSGIMEFSNSKQDASLESFLQEVSLLSDIDGLEDSKNAVTLMTIHASKGLEYPVVFIAGLEENLFPHSNSLETAKEIEEERRLFYVAVTRSKSRLFLSHARMRYRYGNPISALPSRFIAEIDENLIQRSSQQQNNSIEKIKPDIGPDDVKWIKALARKGDESKTSGKNGQFKIGQNVIHAVFGDGKIVKVQGFDSDLKLIVDFASVGRKTLMAQYANLIVRK